MLQHSFLVVIVVASNRSAASMPIINKSLLANCIANQKGLLASRKKNE